MDGGRSERKRNLCFKIQPLNLRQNSYISKVVDEFIIGLHLIFY